MFRTQKISQPLAKHLYFFENLLRLVKSLMLKKNEHSSDFWKEIMLGVTVKGPHFTQQQHQAMLRNTDPSPYSLKSRHHKKQFVYCTSLMYNCTSLMYNMTIKNFSTKWIYLCPEKSKTDVISCDKLFRQANEDLCIWLATIQIINN